MKKIKKIALILLSATLLFTIVGCEYYDDPSVKHPVKYTYDDGSLRIEIEEFVSCNTSCWLAKVTDFSNKSRINRSVACMDYGKDNMTVKDYASKTDAILAVNASGFGNVTSGKLDNNVIHNGRIVDPQYTAFDKTNYVYGSTLAIDYAGNLSLPAYNTNVGYMYYSTSKTVRDKYQRLYGGSTSISDQYIKANENANKAKQEYSYLFLDSLNSLPSDTVTPNDLINKYNVKETVDFVSPILFVNGQKVDLRSDSNESLNGGHATGGNQPRLVLAQTNVTRVSGRSCRQYYILATDGRNAPIFTNAKYDNNGDVINKQELPRSKGVNIPEVQKILEEKANENKVGIKPAYSLDGGGSVQLYFKGKILNHPCEDGVEDSEYDKTTNIARPVMDCIYFK